MSTRLEEERRGKQSIEDASSVHRCASTSTYISAIFTFCFMCAKRKLSSDRMIRKASATRAIFFSNNDFCVGGKTRKEGGAM